MTDRELTQLQETGSVMLRTPIALARLLAGLDTLGIDFAEVRLHGHTRQIRVEVEPPSGVRELRGGRPRPGRCPDRRDSYDPEWQRVDDPAERAAKLRAAMVERSIRTGIAGGGHYG